MRISKALVYRALRTKRKPRPPPMLQCNCSGDDGDGESTKKQFSTEAIEFDIDKDDYAYGVTIAPSGYGLYVYREVLTIDSTTYTNITGPIKAILKNEHFLDYFSSNVKIQTDTANYDANIYLNNQILSSVFPNRYAFIALPITTLTCTYISDHPKITFYIPLLIDTSTNMIYDVTDTLPDEIIPLIDYYFTTVLKFTFKPRAAYRLTMLACQLMPYMDNRYGIMTTIDHIDMGDTEYSGATTRDKTENAYNPSDNKLEGLSISYTFYEK